MPWTAKYYFSFTVSIFSPGDSADGHDRGERHPPHRLLYSLKWFLLIRHSAWCQIAEKYFLFRCLRVYFPIKHKKITIGMDK